MSDKPYIKLKLIKVKINDLNNQINEIMKTLHFEQIKIEEQHQQLEKDYKRSIQNTSLKKKEK